MYGDLTMDELRSELGCIRQHMGKTEASLDHIRDHLATLNGRTGKVEAIISDHGKLIERGKGLWWGVGILSVFLTSVVSFVIKYFTT